jgi:hypothetical protein
VDIAALHPDVEAERILGHILGEFGAHDPNQPWSGREARIPVNADDFPVPELARAALAWAGFVNQPWEDKTAWRLSGRFRDHNMSFALTKFGLRVMLEVERDVDVSEPEEVARRARAGIPPSPNPAAPTSTKLSQNPELRAVVDDFLAALRKAAHVFDKRVLSRLVASQVAAGNVTLLNQHGRLRGAYNFFRWQGRALIDGYGDDDIREQMIAISALAAGRSQDDHPILRRLFTSGLVGSNVGYCLTAMASAYFSWLEHVLVLALPFTTWDPADKSITEVIGSSWGEKWRYVVPEDDDARSILSKLTLAAEQYRNLDAHGGFGKKDQSLLIHTPLGAIPARLTEGVDAIRATIIPEASGTFPEACAIFDATDHFLRTGGLRHAMSWIETGLQVPFNEEHLRNIRETMTAGDDAFDRELELFGEFEDRINNFEY